MCIAILILDLNEIEPLRRMFMAVFAGASVAPILPLVTHMYVPDSPWSAAIFEEIAKTIVILGIIVVMRDATKAWGDGPPFAYHWGLELARAHLAALGAPEPALPPFDESKYEPMPNVEIDPPE